MHKKLLALGRLKTGQRNKTEQAYESMLERMRISGEVLWYKFEGITLKLADNTRYTPDFIVMRNDGQIEAHEIKGYWRDDAKVKIKVAAELFPFRFIAAKQQAKKNGGGWDYEVFE